MKGGFSLLELLVTLLIMGTVAIALGPITRDLARHEKAIAREIVAQDALAFVSAHLRRDAAQAGDAAWEDDRTLRLQLLDGAVVRYLFDGRRMERTRESAAGGAIARRSWSISLARLDEDVPPGTFALRAGTNEVLVFRLACRGGEP